MSAFYSRAQNTSSRLLSRFKQGVIEYVVTESAPGANAWDPPIQTESRLPMDATAKGVTAYQADDLVSISDIGITSAVFGAEPKVGGIVEVDGVQRQVLKVRRIPEAGTLVAWKIYVKG